MNVPTSPIAKLRLLVLWIARSPQRIQKWDNRPGCAKAINYDVDTWWNSTFVMIERAEECRRQPKDTVNDDPDIHALRLTPDDWKKLSDVKKILAPFNEYTEYVSRDSPSIHMAARMFEELRSILLAITERRGDWQNLSSALTIPICDRLTLLEYYHDCVKGNDIYYIASVLDPRIKTKWLKTLPDGEGIIDRTRTFLKKHIPSRNSLYRLL
ncbi:HAT dimerization [Penicillium waksmanii]|uniref:HAT dimerization n=1 Tax=Penicillium waksmanii TaxID=69791 RepID=UPI002547F4E2|nr:HAT dimerization [Penicillium waksmanii]KAJ5976583.1 HAT dimerization [Penicillium waksmanii]